MDKNKVKEYFLLIFGPLFTVFAIYQLRLFYSGDFLTEKLQESISWGYDVNIAIPLIITIEALVGIQLIISYIKLTTHDKEDNSHS